MRAYLIDNPFMNPVTEKLEVIILPSTLYEDITSYITLIPQHFSLTLFIIS